MIKHFDITILNVYHKFLRKNKVENVNLFNLKVIIRRPIIIYDNYRYVFSNIPIFAYVISNCLLSGSLSNLVPKKHNKSYCNLFESENQILK